MNKFLIFALIVLIVLDIYHMISLLKDIKNDPRIASIHSEPSSDYESGKSWWCYLNEGWQDAGNPTSHTLHEERLSDICNLVNSIIPYDEKT